MTKSLIILSHCIVLTLTSLARGQDRGEALRPTQLRTEPVTEQAPELPRRTRASAQSGDPHVATPPPSRDEPRPQPEGASPDSRDAEYRSRREADLREQHTAPRVRRRADFVGPDWDAPEKVRENPSALDGSFRLGLELTLIGHERVNFRIDGLTSFGLTRTLGLYGLSQGAALGVVLGLGLSDNVVLNTRLTLADSANGFGAGEIRHQLKFQISPSLEYVFGHAGSSLRPFIAPMAGLLAGQSTAGNTAINEVTFVAAAQAGLHFFPHPHVSLDPSLTVGYRFGWASPETNGYATTGNDYGITGIYVLLAFGLSYWS